VRSAPARKSRSKFSGVLVALVALLALGASAASATENLPEFQGSGLKYPSTLKGTSLGTAIFDDGGTWDFNPNTFAGEITGSKTFANLTLKFTGVSEHGCAWENETVFANLKGRLGYINKAKKEVGMIFEPTKEPIAKCAQSGVTYYYAGQFIGKVTPVGPSQAKFTVTFTELSQKQQPEFLEGETESFPTRFPLKLAREFSCVILEGKEFCSIKEPKKVALSWQAQFELPVAAVLKA
jgi:hypothetical protein